MAAAYAVNHVDASWSMETSMPHPHELPLVRIYRGNAVELTVDQDEYLRRRREQAEIGRAQRERMSEVLRNRIKPIRYTDANGEHKEQKRGPGRPPRPMRSECRLRRRSWRGCW